MQDVAKTSLYFFGCVAVIGSIAFGNLTRTQIEIGPSAKRTNPIVGSSTLVASNSPGGELSESEYFYVLTQLLESSFVDPVKDQSKLAQGAVRGMIGQLRDPDSIFMSPAELKAYLLRQAGVYEGIGAELSLKFDRDRLQKLAEEENEADAMALFPSLVIQGVMPGSPAEKAGMQPGDRVMAVDGHWILSYEEFQELRTLQDAATTGNESTKALSDFREELSERVEDSISASKGMERLLLGTGKTHTVKWRRDGKMMEASITTAETRVEPVIESGDAIQLRLFKGATDQLKKALAERSTLTLDFRNSGDGTQEELEQVVALLARKGTFATIDSPRMTQPKKLTAPGGSIDPAKITILVNGGTSGSAEMLARVLAAQGAKLEGPAMANDTAWTELHTLPDGSGYVLAVGRFSPIKEELN